MAPVSPPTDSGQTSPEKSFKRDSTSEWAQDPPVQMANAAAGLGSISPFLCTAQFTSLGTMSAKYADVDPENLLR